MSALEKTFTFIGLLGFALLSPGILYALDITAPAEFLATNLGELGNLSLLTVTGFILIGLAIFFGGGTNISATLLGLVVGFLLISTVAELSWMQWFRQFSEEITFLSNLQLNYLTGIATVLLGLSLSFSKKLKFIPQLILIVGLPLAFLGVADAKDLFKFEKQFNLSLDEGFSQLSGIIDEKYQQLPSVKKYLDELRDDESLSEEEKVEKVEKLQGQIQKQEGDIQTLEELKRENEKYKKLLEEQKLALKSVSWCQSAKDTGNKVRLMEEAVKPQQPCVRDFAVSLVKNYQGAYYDTQRTLPGQSGIKQICAIHVHLSSHWSYISDPVAAFRDFFSPADRTLALGMAGDCDDFSILMASSIEAIGGETRVMGGECSGGGHAWAEVLIGSSSDWKAAVKRIRKFYGKPKMKIAHSIDGEGNYWLPLDWRLGNFTCNDYPDSAVVLYSQEKRMELQRKKEIQEEIKARANTQ